MNDLVLRVQPQGLEKTEKIVWSCIKRGTAYWVTGRLRGIDTTYVFFIEDNGISPEQQALDHLLAAQDRVFERFEFMYKAKVGLLDDPKEGVELNWKQYL